MKIGGRNIRSGQAIDIHWHVNPDIDITYIARDKQRQDIPWVKVSNRQTGEETVYQNEDDPLDESKIQSMDTRVMDCVDCHNRPSHIYNSPDLTIDKAMAAGLIDPGIPEIKRVAVEAMTGDYETEPEALRAIESKINKFYKDQYTGIHDSAKTLLQKAISAVQMEFSQNIFPEMKVRWSEYPNNIGHFYWPGCMRCHEGNHANSEGTPITHKCDACHTIMAQGSGKNKMVSSDEAGLEFVHPEDIDEAWRDTGCYECHDGTQP